MHAKIMTFSSVQFYEAKLEAHCSVANHKLNDLTKHPEAKKDLFFNSPLILIDTQKYFLLEEVNEKENKSKYNQGEAKIIQKIVEKLTRGGIKDENIGIISPYQAQINLINTYFEDRRNLEVETVDGFQGREKEVIIISTVRSNSLCEVGFLSDVRRLNVAITRAKRLLVLVCDSKTLAGATHFLKQLCFYFQCHSLILPLQILLDPLQIQECKIPIAPAKLLKEVKQKNNIVQKLKKNYTSLVQKEQNIIEKREAQGYKKKYLNQNKGRGFSHNSRKENFYNFVPFSDLYEKKYLELSDFNYNYKQIIYVYSLRALIDSFENEILYARAVGLDSEWHVQKTSIFQISTLNRTYVFDIAKNPRNFLDRKYMQTMHYYLVELFNCPHIIKVSWDFNHDVEQLIYRFHGIADTQMLTTMRSYVDLLDYQPRNCGWGFSKYCEYYLGKGLNKEYQCCNWRERPLSHEQIIYAAMDSIACIYLYENFKFQEGFRYRAFQYDGRSHYY
jgi:hypothetical protein